MFLDFILVFKMADKEQAKSIEDPMEADLPCTELPEGASGGSEDNGREEGGTGSPANVKNVKQVKRSISTSPKTKDESDAVEYEGLKAFKSVKSSPSPSKKGIKDRFKKMFSPSKGKDSTDEKASFKKMFSPSKGKVYTDEKDNLCEAEATEHPKWLSTPKEKDMGVTRATRIAEAKAAAAKWVSHDKSSSVESGLSGCSSLPDDDRESGVSSPSLEDDKPKK
ncbi:uncharacterized protein LOC129961119 isoform X1 [Argiope bruennichi]|uniref:uncharacterized protein LOC129961119 isoform X1 n=1 Tax=Argiope bruennichi TaxID=94029 RepID=UPI0024949AFF|nr:uncharacterized protein LOC129961119 isoform X1 [Argiope bruennichi]